MIEYLAILGQLGIFNASGNLHVCSMNPFFNTPLHVNISAKQLADKARPHTNMRDER